VYGAKEEQSIESTAGRERESISDSKTERITTTQSQYSYSLPTHGQEHVHAADDDGRHREVEIARVGQGERHEDAHLKVIG
jgi:hypothetical protein